MTVPSSGLLVLEMFVARLLVFLFSDAAIMKCVASIRNVMSEDIQADFRGTRLQGQSKEEVNAPSRTWWWAPMEVILATNVVTVPIYSITRDPYGGDPTINFGNWRTCPNLDRRKWEVSVHITEEPQLVFQYTGFAAFFDTGFQCGGNRGFKKTDFEAKVFKLADFGKEARWEVFFRDKEPATQENFGKIVVTHGEDFISLAKAHSEVEVLWQWGPPRDIKFTNKPQEYREHCTDAKGGSPAGEFMRIYPDGRISIYDRSYHPIKEIPVKGPDVTSDVVADIPEQLGASKEERAQ